VGVLRILLGHAVRNVRHGGLPLVFATMMTSLGVFGLAVFLTVLINLGRVLEEVGDSVGVVAFLEVEAGDDAEGIAQRARKLPGVGEVIVVPPATADARVQRALQTQPLLAQEARGVSIGWVLEVRPPPGGAGFDGRAVTASLEAVPGVDEVMHPGGEVEQVEALLALLRGAGIFLAVLIAFIVVLVVNNTVKLTLYARRDEIGIMKLVGATDLFVRVPFLMEGFAQGLVGAGLALGALYGLHASIAALLETALAGFYGALNVMPMPFAWGLALVGASAVLGVIGAAVSIGRFLKV
jgi:cell division transport system permease protein